MIGAIDRLSPRRRPSGAVAMKHRWADLLFLHWRVSADALRALVPPELSIDTFDGDAYVGLVPFTMTGIRPPWAPAFGPLSDFHETNVRTYVHYRGGEPGVWFFSLDAANSIAVLGARTVWSLPYHRARMSLVHDGAVVRHRTKRLWPGPRPAHCDVEYTPIGEPAAATEGSREFFLAERYFLYARGRSGRLYRGQVHHAPYPLQNATVHALSESLVAAAGVALPQDPPIAHYAREVIVDVFALDEVRDPRGATAGR